jgi:hypothetical protein
MKSRGFAVVVVGLGAVACSGSGGEGASPATPPLLVGFDPAPVVWLPEGGASTDPLTVAGHLEGQLRGIALSSDTSENTGYLGVSEDGSGSLNVTIAARGDRGAGMLIVSLTDEALQAKLAEGHWSSSDALAPDGIVYSSVTACAGPTIGDWPDEVGATDHEIEASEDPEQPGTVVLAVTSHFPTMGYERTPTSELVGTIRFARPNEELP